MEATALKMQRLPRLAHPLLAGAQRTKILGRLRIMLIEELHLDASGRPLADGDVKEDTSGGGKGRLAQADLRPLFTAAAAAKHRVEEVAHGEQCESARGRGEIDPKEGEWALLFDTEELELELEHGVRWDRWRSPPASVGKLGWDGELPFVSSLHELKRLGPPFDDLVGRKGGGLPTRVRAVEFGPVEQRAAVVALAWRRDTRMGASGAISEHAVLQARGGHLDALLECVAGQVCRPRALARGARQEARAEQQAAEAATYQGRHRAQ